MKTALTRLFQGIATLVGFLTSALPIPESLRTWPQVVVVAVYVLVLALVRPTKRWTKIIVVIAPFLGLFFGFWYMNVSQSRTIEIDGQLYVKGQLRSEVRDYLQRNPSVSEEEYFIWIGKRATEVWTVESIGRNKQSLALLYSAFVGLLALGILGGFELFAQSPSTSNDGTESGPEVVED
ncbi:hypothetical protein MYX75_03865 [Acidobacteria bacterium AH-259-A15]|nr:hypothetical protein [Acidobacteria bacterium AH-259-A15]